MKTIELERPFPDYVACPKCGEPEVEVWCYAPTATCHACGHTFTHSPPRACENICNDERRVRAGQQGRRLPQQQCGANSCPPE